MRKRKGSFVAKFQTYVWIAMMQKGQTWKPETMQMAKRIAWQIMMGKWSKCNVKMPFKCK